MENGYKESKFTYDGKEKVTDFNLGWHDYGARHYQPDIGRFPSIDRFAHKYFDFTPYQYGANNPIKYIDVNGDWIYIVHENNNYKYEKGRLYSYDREQSKYVEYTAEKGSFLFGVLQGLNDLSSKTDMGAGLVYFFANGDNHAYIEMGESEKNSEGEGTITLHPQLRGSDIPTTNGIEESPFWLDLGHELAHTKDYLKNGDSVYETWVQNPDTPDKPIRQSEKYATHVENIMRAQAGLPLRTHYAVQERGGYKPTRIISTTGKSLFYTIERNGRQVPINYNSYRNQVMRHIIIVTTIFFLSSCTLKKRLLNEELLNTVNKTSVSRSSYVKDNRKKVFSKLDEGLLEKVDTLVIVEDIVYLQEFYSCAIYSDSLDYYFRARGLAEPQRINLMKEPLYIPELANYIFDKIKKGELEDILEQAKKRESYTPPSNMFITIVIRSIDDKNQFKVKEYDINRFVTREKLEERKRIRRRD